MEIEGVRDFKSIVWLGGLEIHKVIVMGFGTPNPTILLTGERVELEGNCFSESILTLHDNLH